MNNPVPDPNVGATEEVSQQPQTSNPHFTDDLFGDDPGEEQVSTIQPISPIIANQPNSQPTVLDQINSQSTPEPLQSAPQVALQTEAPSDDPVPQQQQVQPISQLQSQVQNFDNAAYVPTPEPVADPITSVKSMPSTGASSGEFPSTPVSANPETYTVPASQETLSPVESAPEVSVETTVEQAETLNQPQMPAVQQVQEEPQEYVPPPATPLEEHLVDLRDIDTPSQPVASGADALTIKADKEEEEFIEGVEQIHA